MGSGVLKVVKRCYSGVLDASFDASVKLLDLITVDELREILGKMLEGKRRGKAVGS
jgi:hypothetical protein